MIRRDLLRLWLALMTSTHVARGSMAQSEKRSSPNKKRVLVIGAGLAGLAAARQLHDLGNEVLVIEARDRIGGRLWTSNKWPEFPLDLGASWIHGTEDNPLTELAESIDAELIMTSYDRARFYNTDGDEISDKEEKSLERLSKQFTKAIQVAQEADEDKAVQRVLDELALEMKATPELRRMLNFLLNSQIEHEYSGSGKRLSAHWYDTEKSFEGEDALFASGYQVIVHHLSRGLNIRLGQVVSVVDWSQHPARVKTEQAEFQADQILVTVPLGVLKSEAIQFVPELPKATKQALNALEMGVLNKCYLQFDQVFWPDDVDWIEYIPESHGAWTEWVSFARTTGAPVLLGFNAADRGREIESWTDQQIVSSAMRTLRIIFGDDIPDPLDFQITRWASDPFTLGSYSFNPVGSHPRMRKTLAKPLNNRVFFAGEATDVDYFATAHGAYLSGLRAANEIANG